MASKAAEPQCSCCLPPSKGRSSLLPDQAHPLQRAGSSPSYRIKFLARVCFLAFFLKLMGCLFPPGLFTLSVSKQPNHSAKQWGHYKLHRRCYHYYPMIPSVSALTVLFSWAIWEDSASQQNIDVRSLKGSASHTKDTSISLTIITLRNRVFPLFSYRRNIWARFSKCISSPR